MKKKILVALSGGVDSSVVLYLLKKEGYELVSTTMLLHSGQDEDIKAAERLAKKFSVPFFVSDLTDLFKEKVENYFLNSYKNGYTPNPCIECNRYIKSKALLEIAKKNDCSNLATGHYAKIYSDVNGWHLAQGDDKKRDQSYFLYPYKKDDLKKILFPLEKLSKDRVREIAKSNGIETAEKKDSQDICFDYKPLLTSLNSVEKIYPIIYKDKIVGQHNGIHNFTIGQRSGLGVAVGYPVYVKKLRKTDNAVVLSDFDELYTDTVRIKNINILEEQCDEVLTKIRSTTSAKLSTYEINGDEIIIKFKEKVSAVAKGQSAVLYSPVYPYNIVAGGIIV